MKKKLFSIIMCVLMVMCFMPTAAFAAGVNVSENPEAEGACNHEAAISVTADGKTTTTHYNTLAEAISAAGDSDNVVTLIGNATVSDSTTKVKNLTIADGVKLSFSGTGKLKVTGNLTVKGTLDLNGVDKTDFTNETEAVDRTLIINQGATFDIYGTVISKSNSNDICQLGTMTIYAGAKFYTDSSTLYIGGANDAALNRLSSGTVVSTPITAGSFADGYYYDITGTAEAGTTDIPFPITGNDVFRVKDGAKLTATNISTAYSAKAASCIEVESGGTLAVGTKGNVTFTNALGYMKSGATFEPTENITIAKVSSGKPIFFIQDNKEFTLNLNNKTITSNTNNTFYIKVGRLNVIGSGEIKMGDDNKMLFTVKGNKTANTSEVTKLVVGKDVKITGGLSAITVDRNTSSNGCTSGYDAEVDIYGSLSGKETIYVTGNLTATDGGNVPEIRLHSGAKIEDTCGIYLAGYAKTTIEDGVSIKATDGNAISIAAGELTINGGKFESPSTIGTSEGTGGAIDEKTSSALSVKQHVTNLPLIVNVNGGTFEAAIPINQQTGQSGASAEPSKVQLSITDGTFTSTSSASGATSIKSADKTGFITGGTFSTNPTAAYIADDYIVERTAVEGGYTYTVVKKSNLGAGTYMADPTDYLANRCYVGETDSETYWTVYRRSSSSSSSTSTTTDNVTNTTETTKTDTGATTTVPETKATVSSETKTAADGTKTTTSTVDATTATKIVDKAVANKSEEVIVNAGTTAVAETAAGTTTEVAIPAETVSQIAEKTTAAVTIETEAAEVTLDEQAVEAVAEQAGETGSVKLVVETKSQDENKVEVELKIETENGTVSDFKGGNVTVTVKLNSALAAKPVTCVYIDDNGVYHKVAGHKNADGTYTFTTGHFSTYAIMAVEEADAAIAKQADSAKELVAALSFKARSTKTAKGSIKVNLTVDEKSIKAIEDLGYTVKYKFYRSTKKSSGYKAKIEGTGKTYINTAGKKGTRYYYKARVMVYDSEGTLIAKSTLKQCKYAARIK